MLLNNSDPLETSQSTESWFDRKGSSFVLTALVLSLVLNIFFVVQRIPISEESAPIRHSAYGISRLRHGSFISADTRVAHLAKDFAVAWASNSSYFGEDEALADRLWDDISIDNGTVALDDAYVEAMGLPISQRFPWDQEKGLYLLNGFHSMHCLVSYMNFSLAKCGLIAM